MKDPRATHQAAWACAVAALLALAGCEIGVEEPVGIEPPVAPGVVTSAPSVVTGAPSVMTGAPSVVTGTPSVVTSAPSAITSDPIVPAPTATVESPLVESPTMPAPARPQVQPPAAQNPRIAKGRLNFVSGYRAGYEAAARQSKPMLIYFTAEWCRYCHQMADEAFTHPQVVALSQRFVCILIDADSEPAVCQQFQVTGYPTIQFLSPRGLPLERVVGKKPGHQLMMAMQSALSNVARRDDDPEAPSR